MTRLARMVVAGLPHHVTQRGNRREAIFFEDGDHDIYRDLLAVKTRKAGVEVWAYCLMPNHVHLILTPTRAEGLGLAVGKAHRRYTNFHQRTWTLDRPFVPKSVRVRDVTSNSPSLYSYFPSNASFIETMDCLPVSKLPEGPKWTYEIKLDGYRLEVVRSAGKTTLYSRRQNVFNQKFPQIAAALKDLPDDTVIDGEVVALGADGRPDFNLLQNFRSAESRIHYYAFDILIHRGRRVTELPLSERRVILSSVIEPSEHVTLSQVSNRSAAEMLKFIKSHGLEGAVAKRSDSVYQPGQRTGLWSKYPVNLDQEFVVGGYIPSNLGVDSLVVGFYRGKDLIYAARVRAGLVPTTRREVFERLKHLQTTRCPFVNLPELTEGRWGQGLTAEKMKECALVRPELVARIQFLEWTGADHLRHTKFVALRDDKDPSKVVRET